MKKVGTYLKVGQVEREFEECRPGFTTGWMRASKKLAPLPGFFPGWEKRDLVILKNRPALRAGSAALRHIPFRQPSRSERSGQRPLKGGSR